MDLHQRISSLSPTKMELLAHRMGVGTGPGEGASATNGDSRLVGYIVPGLEHQSTVEGGGGEWQQERVSEWLALYDELYAGTPDDPDPTFNIIGWDSSYTGQPISAEEMAEQVEASVERVLSLQPRRVLEIGVGTGLLLHRIAPSSAYYLATDFSAVALDYLRPHLASLPQVELSERVADDFSGLPDQSFDTVILNSVIQYFPSIDYLRRVLEGAVRVTTPQGHIFIGDVRSLPLLETFHASVELHRAPASQLTSFSLERGRRQMLQEKELVVDPAFFPALSSHLPSIRRVEVSPKRGRFLNELTRFRYDAVIQVGGDGPPSAPSRLLAWEQVGGLRPLRRLLARDAPDAVAIRGIPVTRLEPEQKALDLMADRAGPATVGELREVLTRRPSEAVDPEELWALEGELAYHVHLRFSAAPGCYDAVFRRRAHSGPAALEGLAVPARPQPWSAYANDPLQAKLSHTLIPALRSLLQERLPDHMIPSAFVILETLPLTPNGKVDRGALPPPAERLDLERPGPKGRSTAPRTDLEQAVAEVWQEVLGLEEAEAIGVRDNFFDLGGHSLLAIQVISRLRRRLGIELPMRRLFEAPTVAELAERIERDLATANNDERALASMLSLVEQLSESEVNALLLEVADAATAKGD